MREPASERQLGERGEREAVEIELPAQAERRGNELAVKRRRHRHSFPAAPGRVGLAEAEARVEKEGLEPSSAACKAGALPVELHPRVDLRAADRIRTGS